jgi:hypothetical protein
VTRTMRLLVGLIALGTAIRLALALGTDGNEFDLLVPTVLAEASRSVDGGWPEAVVRWVYVPMMIGVLLAFVVGWARMLRTELAAAASPAQVAREAPAVT